MTWGHAPAQHLERASVNPDGDSMHLATYVGGVSAQCEACRAFEKALRVPIEGTSAVLMFQEKLQVVLSLLSFINM